MRHEPNLRIDKYREIHPHLGDSPHGANYGFFVIKKGGRENIRIISSGTDMEFKWEHVSVSLSYRTPTWEEMQTVKELFWRDDELVVQYHMPSDNNINCHPFCLHLWKPIEQTIPVPPSLLVGFQAKT